MDKKTEQTRNCNNTTTDCGKSRTEFASEYQMGVEKKEQQMRAKQKKQK